jgi:tRNA-(ms[2]io[6]A)-hydroxylase
MTAGPSSPPDTPYEAVFRELPLLRRTAPAWAQLATRDMPTFLADHAVCEQQAALTGLHLVAQYPDDGELVEQMTSLAAEEVLHLRRVARLLHARGLAVARRRANPYVNGLRARMETQREPARKIDRLLVGALIEARSCERFTRLLEVVRDEAVADLLRDLGPAEKRHWQMFHGLALRETDPNAFEDRWQHWLGLEDELISGLGLLPRVHG